MRFGLRTIAPGWYCELFLVNWLVWPRRSVFFLFIHSFKCIQSYTTDNRLSFDKKYKQYRSKHTALRAPLITIHNDGELPPTWTHWHRLQSQDSIHSRGDTITLLFLWRLHPYAAIPSLLSLCYIRLGGPWCPLPSSGVALRRIVDGRSRWRLCCSSSSWVHFPRSVVPELSSSRSTLRGLVRWSPTVKILPFYAKYRHNSASGRACFRSHEPTVKRRLKERHQKHLIIIIIIIMTDGPRRLLVDSDIWTSSIYSNSLIFQHVA